jgi:hypothetical protein
MLSPRVLHFSRRQFYWECNELFASEGLPNGFPQMLALKDRLTIEKAGNSVWGLFKLWATILGRYTAAGLTYRSDTLIALSGIARRLHDLSGETYLVGIWKSTDEHCFVAHLACHCEPTLPRPVEYRAPTWSWASTDNKVTLDPTPSTPSGFWNVEVNEINIRAKVIDAQITLATSNVTGNASSGYIAIEGPLKRITVQPEGKVTMNGDRLEMNLFLDEPLEREMDMFTLPLYEFSADDMDSDQFLETHFYFVLTLSEKEIGCYARCGLGRTDAVTSTGGWLDSEALIWDAVTNGFNAPCDESLGPRRGHRIRIV